MSTIAIQNTGIDAPKRAKTVKIISATEYGFVADMIPIGIPSISARISAPTESMRVLGKELRMSSNIILFDT
jgi:hypothetical protein